MGGAEIVASEQARLLRHRGFEVAVFAGDFAPASRSRPKTILSSDATASNRAFKTMKIGPKDFDEDAMCFKHAYTERQILRFCAVNQTKIFHAHNLNGLSFGVLPILHDQGVQTVVTLHDYCLICARNTLLTPNGTICQAPNSCSSCKPFFTNKWGQRVPIRLRNDFLRYCSDHVDRFIAPSCFVKNIFVERGFPARQIEVLSNGIDLKRFTHAPRVKLQSAEDKLHLLCVGRLDVHKGQANAIRAVASDSLRSLVTLTLVGEGPERRNLEDMVKSLGVAHLVHMAGEIPNSKMPEVYRAHDVLITPSIWLENQPVVIMEAMATGLPIVASNMGGIPELVQSGVTGLLVRPGDVDALSGAIKVLVDDTELALRFGARGRMEIEKHSIEASLERLASVYQELLSQKSTRPNRVHKLFAVTGLRWGRASGLAKTVNSIRITMDGEDALLTKRRWIRRTLIGRIQATIRIHQSPGPNRKS